jgi:O-antigen/teichoic acid export membrane protein
MPVFSRAAARGAGELLVLVRRTAAVLASVAFPAAAMAPFVGGLLLEAIWKPGTVSEATRRCVPLLAIAGVAIFLTYPQMHALTALGRQRVLAWITFGSGLLKLGVSWLCIERGGIEGAALATAITELSVLGWVSFELRRAAHRTAFSRALVRPLATSAIAAGVAFGLSGTTPAIATAATVVVLLFAVAMGGALPLRLEDLR